MRVIWQTEMSAASHYKVFFGSTCLIEAKPALARAVCQRNNVNYAGIENVVKK